MVDAINARDFSPNSPAWKNCAPSFRAERGGFRSSEQKRWVSLQGLLDDLKDITTRSPNYHLELREHRVQPGSTAQSAIFHAHHVVTGDPPGIAMCVVGVMAFEKINNEYKAMTYSATMGPPAVDANWP